MHKNRALLLDRDGVINVDHGYVGQAWRFDFMPGIFPFLRAARDLGFRLAVFTNQSGVARGHYTAADHDEVTAHMLKELKKEGVDIDLPLVSFDHPDGTVPPYARESFWRKPNPGMALEIVRRLDLNPGRSACLGDNLRDVQAAQGAGIGTLLWLTDKADAPPQGVRTVRGFDEALAILSA